MSVPGGHSNGAVDVEPHVCDECRARLAELERDLKAARQRVFNLESDVGAAVTLLSHRSS